MPDCRIARLPDCRIAGLPDCQIARLELIGQRLTGMILTTIVIPKQRCTPVAVLAEWLNERMEWNGMEWNAMERSEVEWNGIE